MTDDVNSFGQGYSAWLREVDELCRARFGLGLSELPDFRIRDAFDDDVSPAAFFSDVVLPKMRKEFGNLFDKV